MSTKRAAIYARISETARDRDKVADQIAQARRLAERRGYSVADDAVFSDDGISALGGRTRPDWDRLLDAIVAGRIDVVLATEEERFARNVSDKADLQAACIAAGVTWETERDGFVDPASEAGEFFSTMRAAMGRMESRRKAARQKSRNAAASAEGKPVPGRRRFGYESDACTPREAEAVIVQRMFEHVAAGGSLRGILRFLAAEQVDPSPGKAWTSRRVRDTLLSQHYAGVIRHRGVYTPSDVVVPIVDPGLASEVRAMLDDPSRRTTSGSQPVHLASGIAVCGTCGASIYHQARGYRCPKDPKHPAIRKDYLDDRIREEVARAFLTTGADLLPAATGGVSLPDLVAEHARNGDRVAAILDDRDEGLIPPDVAKGRLRTLAADRARIEADLERARAERGAAGALAQLASTLLVGDTMTVAAWRESAEAIVARFDALDIDSRLEIVRALLYVQVDAGRDPSRVRVLHLRADRLNVDDRSDYGAA